MNCMYCQRWFTKRRTVWARLPSAISILWVGKLTQVRRIKYDLIMCYKIVKGKVSLHRNFLHLSVSTHTRGHKYKLYKHHSSVNAHKYFFSNRICDIWNALPSSVVEASSLDCFKRLQNQVDLLQLTVLLWLCACIFCFWVYVSGYLPFMSSDLFIKLCLLACLLLVG